MRVEPAASLDGHFAVPGDKSVSHRALLIGALSDGETRVRGWGRSGDTESTLGAVRALGVDVDEQAPTRSSSTASACAACGSGDDRLRQRRHARAAGRSACSPSRTGTLHARPATSRSRAGRWSASPSRCAAWARRSRRPTGSLPLTITGAALERDRLRAAGRERAGEVGDPARRARRDRPHDRDRAGADARPHRADAARRPAPRVTHAAAVGQRSTRPSARPRLGRRARATSPRRRRSSSPRRCSPTRASRSTTSTSTRCAPGSSTCSSGWAARVGILNAPQDRRASRSATSRSARPS